MNLSEQRKKLADAVSALTPVPQHPALQHLVESLQRRHEACAVSILFYGSCLRSGDPYDGLVDLYLIVDSYRGANSSMARAFWNWLLPPNVFYAEFPYEGKTIRCKYAVLTLEDFERGTSPRWFHSYLWGRFSQPTAIAWSRSPDIHACIANGLAQAVTTLLYRALPGVPASGSAQSLWQNALQLSYGTELRPESQSRAQQLAQHNQDYYRIVTGLAAPLLSGSFTYSPDDNYHFQDSSPGRVLNKLGWRLRSLQGKCLSLARLSKALFTFDGGLDYIAWKLERHSGEKIEIPENVRRYPLIFIWGMVWRLYRRGIFR